MVIEEEFRRVLGPSVAKSAKWIPSGVVHFGTDLGLRREENQDRVAVLKWSDPIPGSPSLLAVAVVDGMGGMLDGALCATITLSAYFSSLHQNVGLPLMERVKIAAQYANKRVYDSYRGKGGATLSSIVIAPQEGAVSVNVGDSRIYGLARSPVDWSVRRLSIDDTLKEAFQSEGNGLIQYIGVGSGLHPHVSKIDPEVSEVVLTTDGAHYIDQHIFERILSTAPDIKARTDRSIALARWLGGHDNITVATIDVAKAGSLSNGPSDRMTSIFSPSADLSFLILSPESNGERVKDEPSPVSGQPQVTKAIRAKRKPTEKKRNQDSRHEQLAIDIEVSSPKDLDDNSKPV